jgi:undecaprenyl phosphate-alpha-L-ara4N flippase subunit ArnE
MWQLLCLSVIQSAMLALGQLTLKMALQKMPTFEWTFCFCREMLTNWWFLLCGLLFGGGSLLWMYILRHYPLNTAYPLASLSYLFAMLFGVVFLHETVTWSRLAGVLLIMIGCVFIVK